MSIAEYLNSFCQDIYKKIKFIYDTQRILKDYIIFFNY